MTRYTIKNLRQEVQSINDFVIENTEYKIKIIRQYGANYLYQQRRNCKDGRVVRLLFAGTARECEYYLRGFRAWYWYFDGENDLPF